MIGMPELDSIIAEYEAHNPLTPHSHMVLGLARDLKEAREALKRLMTGRGWQAYVKERRLEAVAFDEEGP